MISGFSGFGVAVVAPGCTIGRCPGTSTSRAAGTDGGAVTGAGAVLPGGLPIRRIGSPGDFGNGALVGVRGVLCCLTLGEGTGVGVGAGVGVSSGVDTDGVVVGDVGA